MTAPVRALIVDDEDDMRALIRATIRRANEGLEVAAEAADGEKALELWRRHRPEVVVVDQRMPGLTGLEVAEQILAEDPDQSIILFSAYIDHDIEAAANSLGIRECLPKNNYRHIPEALWRNAPAAS